MDAEKLVDNFINLYEDLKILSKNHPRDSPLQVKNYLNSVEAEIQNLSKNKINKSSFDVIKHIGKGGYGDVYLIKNVKGSKSTNDVNPQYYALKATKKSDISEENGTDGFMAERDVLKGGNFSEYIIKLIHSFQDTEYLYYVMEFMQGGDLDRLLNRLNEAIYDQSTSLDMNTYEKDWKFYMAEIINGINAVHKLGYIHRDLKPANVLIDNTGHIKLADFGTCLKMVDGKNKVKFSTGPGTLDYICPEVLKNSTSRLECYYGPELDWWSFGVILYECLMGECIFYDEDTMSTKQFILDHENFLIENKGNLFAPEDQTGFRISKNFEDLVLKLLSHRSKRLGRNSGPASLQNSNIDDLKNHPWFSGVDWTFENIRSHPPPFSTFTAPKDGKEAVEDLVSNFDDIDEEDHYNDLSNFQTRSNFGNRAEYKGENLQFVGFSFNSLLLPGRDAFKAVDSANSSSYNALRVLKASVSKVQQSIKNQKRLKSIIDQGTQRQKIEILSKNLAKIDISLLETDKDLHTEQKRTEKFESSINQLEDFSEDLKDKMKDVKFEVLELKSILQDIEEERKVVSEKFDILSGEDESFEPTKTILPETPGISNNNNFQNDNTKSIREQEIKDLTESIENYETNIEIATREISRFIADNANLRSERDVKSQENISIDTKTKKLNQDIDHLKNDLEKFNLKINLENENYENDIKKKEDLEKVNEKLQKVKLLLDREKKNLTDKVAVALKEKVEKDRQEELNKKKFSHRMTTKIATGFDTISMVSAGRPSARLAPFTAYNNSLDNNNIIDANKIKINQIRKAEIELKKLRSEKAELARDKEIMEQKLIEKRDNAKKKYEQLVNKNKELEEELEDIKKLEQNEVVSKIEYVNLSGWMQVDSKVLEDIRSKKQTSIFAAQSSSKNIMLGGSKFGYGTVRGSSHAQSSITARKTYRNTGQRSAILNFTSVYGEIDISDKNFRLFTDDTKNEIITHYKISLDITQEPKLVEINELRKYRNKNQYEFAINKMFKVEIDNGTKVVYFIGNDNLEADAWINKITEVLDIEPDAPDDLPPVPNTGGNAARVVGIKSAPINRILEAEEVPPVPKPRITSRAGQES